MKSKISWVDLYLLIDLSMELFVLKSCSSLGFYLKIDTHNLRIELDNKHYKFKIPLHVHFYSNTLPFLLDKEEVRPISLSPWDPILDKSSSGGLIVQMDGSRLELVGRVIMADVF